MTEPELIKTAYAAAHQAADITTSLVFGPHEKSRKDRITSLLEQSRLLASAAQALEQLARGHMPPRVGG